MLSIRAISEFCLLNHQQITLLLELQCYRWLCGKPILRQLYFFVSNSPQQHHGGLTSDCEAAQKRGQKACWWVSAFSSISHRGPESFLPILLSFRTVLEAVNTVNMSTEWYICLTRNRHMDLCVDNCILCRASEFSRVFKAHSTLKKKIP